MGPGGVAQLRQALAAAPAGHSRLWNGQRRSAVARTEEVFDFFFEGHLIGCGPLPFPVV